MKIRPVPCIIIFTFLRTLRLLVPLPILQGPGQTHSQNQSQSVPPLSHVTTQRRTHYVNVEFELDVSLLSMRQELTAVQR